MINYIKYLVLVLTMQNVFADEDSLSNEKYIICNAQRITPSNYMIEYRKIKNEYFNFQKNTTSTNDFNGLISWIEYNQENDLDPNDEVCKWNKFIVLDFLIYYSQLDEILGKHHRIDVLDLRNKYYTDWMKALDNQIQQSKKNSKRIPLESIERDLNSFRSILRLTDLINSKPKPEENDLLSKAQLDLYNLLSAKTIFHSIFPDVVKKNLLNAEILNHSKCILEKLTKYSEGENVWTIATQCGAKENALLILGVLSSQRMYLIRDFKLNLFLNLDLVSYNNASELLNVTSLIYFELENYGNKFGASVLYPKGFSEGKFHSSKPYHFYSVAYISSHLKQMGHEDDIIQKIANFYAKKYKVGIKYVGVLYNILLINNLKSGPVSDQEQILIEQSLGAEFGLF